MVHGLMAKNEFTERSFTNLVAHCELRISMRVWATGTFNPNEAVFVYVDTKLVWTDKRYYNSSDPLICQYDWKTYPGLGYPGIGPFCYQDIEFFVPHTAPWALVRVSTNLDELSSNEAVAFSGLQIEVFIELQTIAAYISLSLFAGDFCLPQTVIHVTAGHSGCTLEQFEHAQLN